MVNGSGMRYHDCAFDFPDNHPDPYEPTICTRLDYHDGPCNGYENSRCALKHKLEREGKIMGPGDKFVESYNEQLELEKSLKTVIRPWHKQLWAWITGRL